MEEQYSFIRAKLRFLNTAEGGRKTPLIITTPFSYRPNSVADGAAPSLQYATHFTEAVGTINPGDEVETELILFYAPDDPYADFIPGARFGIYEGGRRVADGMVRSRFTRSVSEWRRICDERMKAAQ